MITDFASESNVIEILKQLLRKPSHDGEASGLWG